MLQMVAAIMGLLLILWSTGFPGVFRHAEAAMVTSASDTLSDSAPGTVSNHTITFTTSNGLVSGEAIALTFDNTFTFPGAGFDFNDIDVTTSGLGEVTLAASAGSGNWGVDITGNVITLTVDGASVASSSQITIEIGTNATSGSTGDAQISNPSATGSVPIEIGGTMQDSGSLLVTIIEGVTLSASVNTVFDFAVAGVASGATVNSSPTTTATGTTATTLPFGTLVAGTSKTLAHDLSVTTNAKNGFSVTVEQSGDLTSATGATINGFIDGAYTDTPTAWVAPSASVGNADTYGHWGITSDDSDFSVTADQWVSGSTTPRTIFSHNAVADGTGVGQGTARVGYQIQISSLQEAGTDYSTTITYIATPTF